jgi:hypothetical protein
LSSSRSTKKQPILLLDAIRRSALIQATGRECSSPIELEAPRPPAYVDVLPLSLLFSSQEVSRKAESSSYSIDVLIRAVYRGERGGRRQKEVRRAAENVERTEVRREDMRCDGGTGGRVEAEGGLRSRVSRALHRKMCDESVRVVLSRAPCWLRRLVLASRSRCETGQTESSVGHGENTQET